MNLILSLMILMSFGNNFFVDIHNHDYESGFSQGHQYLISPFQSGYYYIHWNNLEFKCMVSYVDFHVMDAFLVVVYSNAYIFNSDGKSRNSQSFGIHYSFLLNPTNFVKSSMKIQQKRYISARIQQNCKVFSKVCEGSQILSSIPFKDCFKLHSMM